MTTSTVIVKKICTMNCGRPTGDTRSREEMQKDCDDCQVIEPLFYMQDSRSFVGNDMTFWRRAGAGYTTDLRDAELWTKEAAQAQHNARETDIPWPKDYIDAKTRPAVDMQYVRRDEALQNSGITINRPQHTEKNELYNCVGCGRFITNKGRFESNCAHCGSDNRP